MENNVAIILLVAGLLVWIVTALWTENVPRSFWIWLTHPENTVRAVATVFSLFGIFFFILAMYDDTGEFAKTFAPNLATDSFAIAITIFVIDQLNHRRDQFQQRAERKRNIIRQMASRSNEFALDAAQKAKDEGWLWDGSLLGADLIDADLQNAFLGGADLQGALLALAKLQGANLINAKLQEAWLVDANLQRAVLKDAKLQEAKLLRADLRRAILISADLQGAVLIEAKLQGAMLAEANLRKADLRHAQYSKRTEWPDGFDPSAAGAILVDEAASTEQNEE